MKKKFWLIIALCMAMSVCLGLGFTQTKANAAETNTVSGLFRMKDGASVRVAQPYGIRFTTEVGADYTASLESVHSGKTFKFGTQLKITAADGVTKGMNIEAEKFVDTTEGRLYNTVVTDIPEEFFNTFVTAASYVKVYDGETLVTTYYADNNGQTRSAAQVASRALADGKTDAVLSEYVKNAEDFSFGGATGTLMLGKSDLNDYLTVNPSKITPVYRSGDETVATVDKDGMITAKKTGGQVLITATLGNKSATCTFTVGNEGVIYQSEEKLGYCGWPTVAKIYDDKLISVWSLRQTHQDPYGKVVGAISEDNGVTWGEPFTIIDTVLDDRDAGVIFWNNKVIVSTVSVSKHIYLNSGNQEWIDYTNAITDEQEAEALGCKYVIGELVNGELTFGEIKKAPAFTPHGMIKLANGDLGYVGYDGYDRETGITKTKITFYSSADGETWSKVSEVFGANEFLVDKLNEPNAIVLKNGKMIVAVRSESGIYIAESTDGGVTFSNKRALLSAAISTPPHLMQMTDGTLVLSYGYRSEPYNIRAIVSKDNGESWSNEIELTSGGVDWDFGYPATIERGNGELLTVYYQKLSADKKNTALKEVIWTIPENLTYGDKAVVTNDVTSAAFALRADAQATTLTVGEEGGENVITYASTADNVYNARAQLSGKMLDLITANRQLGGKALTLDFKYEGDVSTLQLWYYTPGIAAKTLKELIDDKVATLAYNGYSIGWERVSKGVWYTLYVDLDKFAAKYGEIVYSASGNDCGLQAATISTLKVKGIEFISAAEIPALTEAIDAFQKFQNCTVETDAETGITTYTGLSDDWGSRAQFTMAMFNKCVEYYALTEDYSVSMEFRYTGDVKNMQFWVYTPSSGTQAPTLNSLIDAGTAVVVADGYRFSFGELVKDKWYKVYIDIHKFGAIKISDPNIGVQVASQTSIQYKMPEFVKNSDIPVAKEPLIPFEKVSAGVALSTVYRDGAFITSYTGTSSDWDSRIQLTDNAFAKYTENYNAGNAFMTFDIRYVGAVADFQFWKMNASGGYGETPTLSGLISSGVVIVYKNGESCTYKEIVVGEWYTLQFDMSLFGALGTNESNHGFQFGAQTSIEFKNFEFVTK